MLCVSSVSQSCPPPNFAKNPCREFGKGACLCGRYLRRENEPDHIRGLRGRRAAAPHRVNGRSLVGAVGPALARQLAKFREPIGKGLVLPPRNVFLKCSGHLHFLLVYDRQRDVTYVTRPVNGIYLCNKKNHQRQALQGLSTFLSGYRKLTPNALRHSRRRRTGRPQKQSKSLWSRPLMQSC